jgi:hypothetical protein
MHSFYQITGRGVLGKEAIFALGTHLDRVVGLKKKGEQR